MAIKGYTDLYRSVYGDLKDGLLRDGIDLFPSYVLDGKLEVIIDEFDIPQNFEPGDTVDGTFLKRPGTLVNLIVYPIEVASDHTTIRFWIKDQSGSTPTEIIDYDSTGDYESMISEKRSPLYINDTSFITLENHTGSILHDGKYQVIAFVVRQ